MTVLISYKFENNRLSPIGPTPPATALETIKRIFTTIVKRERQYADLWTAPSVISVVTKEDTFEVLIEVDDLEELHIQIKRETAVQLAGWLAEDESEDEMENDDVEYFDAPGKPSF